MRSRVPIHTSVSTQTYSILKRHSEQQDRYMSGILDDAIKCYDDVIGLASNDQKMFRDALTPEERKHVLANILRKRAEKYEVLK